MQVAKVLPIGRGLSNVFSDECIFLLADTAQMFSHMI